MGRAALGRVESRFFNQGLGRRLASAGGAPLTVTLGALTRTIK